MDKKTNLVDPHPETVPQPPAREQLSMLVESGRQLVETEVEYLRGRLNYSGQILKQTGLWGALSLFCLFGAVIALILGVLLIIAHYFGPEIATLSVTVTFIVFALIFALLARHSAKKLSMPELSED